MCVCAHACECYKLDFPNFMAQFGSLCQTCFASSVSVRVLYHCCFKHVESLMEVINFYFSLAILSSWWADAEMVLFPRSSFWNTAVVYIFLIRREQWSLLIFKALFRKLKKPLTTFENIIKYILFTLLTV